MKIGMLVDSYMPYISGVTNHIAVTKKFLEDKGHEVFVFTFGALDYEDKEKNVYRSPGIPLMDSGLYFGLGYSKENRALVETMDVVHFHHPIISGYAFREYLKPLNIPGIFTNHTRYDLMQKTYLPAIPEELGDFVISSYLKELCHEADRVIAPSNSLKNALRELGIDVDINVVPNGINLRDMNEISGKITRESLGINSDDLVLTYVGRIAPEKSIDIVIDAYSGVLDIFPNLKLLIVGEGPTEDELKEQVNEAGLAESVIFTGLVGYSDVPDYLNIADIFVTASIAEVHPLTVLEAMAAGLPVVGVESPGVGDIVVDGQTGLLAQNTLASYTANLSKMVMDSGFREKAGENSKREAEQYSIEKTGALLLDLYNEVIAEKRAIDGN